MGTACRSSEQKPRKPPECRRNTKWSTNRAWYSAFLPQNWSLFLPTRPSPCIPEATPLAGIEILALFPNKTWVRATTDEAGDAALNLYTTNLPMTIYAAGSGYAAGLERAWTPGRDGLRLELEPLEAGGAAIFAQSTGHLPGLRGRLEPIRDTSNRTYLYADNIAIDEGRQQPVSFRPGKPLRLTDAQGAELSVTIVDIIGQSALIEYRPLGP